MNVPYCDYKICYVYFKLCSTFSSIPALLKLAPSVVCSTKISKDFGHLNTLFSAQFCNGPKCLPQHVLTVFQYPKLPE